MPLMQVTYEVPPEIAVGLVSGEMQRFGSVVRDSTKIIGHLKEIETDVKDKDSNEAAAAAVVVIGGIVVLAAAGVGIGYAFKKRGMKKRVRQFQTAFEQYRNAIQDGKLNETVLRNLDDALKEIYDYSKKGIIKIAYVPEVFNAFREIVADYTKKLAEVNDIEYDEPNYSSDNSIIDIRQYLAKQADILNSKVA